MIVAEHVTITLLLQQAVGGEKMCCGPVAMEPLSVIHMDEHGQIHYAILHDFIVKECSCRY